MRDEVADEVGLGSGDTYQRHKKVIEWAQRDAPELVDMVREGRATVPEVSAAMKQREMERERAQARAVLDAIGDHVAGEPQAVQMLLEAQQRANHSSAKATITRFLVSIPPDKVVPLLAPEDRPAWEALSATLRRWADAMDAELRRSHGLRLVQPPERREVPL